VCRVCESGDLELPIDGAGTPAARIGRAGFKRDGTSAKTRFRLSEKRTSPFESAGVST
jgi:hypothetical protein